MQCPLSYQEPDLQEAYLAGWDCAKFGADSTNCNFQWFTTPELTAAWERGKAGLEFVENFADKIAGSEDD